MGIPKFFRFISERYPCISEPIQKDTYVHEFDNLYLDMNGIIHMCSYPDDSLSFNIDEEKVFKDIFHYIEYLFQLINPRKLFFMAIDGVAPRAKMNQQRCRRFQSAREAEELKQKAIEKGEISANAKSFDKNCITPGTVFMARLHEQLRYFVKQNISTNRNWAKCKIVLSGHETPGEGEHKVMDYIRYLRAQPDHDPNTRHCLYGQDADLIMLGFCTHEPNFSILREEVVFGKNQPRRSSPEHINFYLLHLSLLRDYIEQEFLTLKDALSFPFDIYKLIDDWVLLGFLIGNDFIPNLPNLVINKNALPQLYDMYKKVLPTLDGYLNEGGKLNLSRFQIYMTNLAELDREKFQEISGDLKYLESKTGKKFNKNDEPKEFDYATFLNGAKQSPSENKSGFKLDLDALIASTDEMVLAPGESLFNSYYDEDKSDDDSSDMFDAEFLLHKRDYYINKLLYENVTEDVLRSQAEGYVQAIQWILNYYYQGCCSWSWYYPHHYAPYLSDIVNFKDMEITFEKGKPFMPFEQLLAVLPVASKDLLPEAFHHLMTSEQSPIYHWYPLNFETDLNGKMQQWEAVVLLPFIEEKQFLSAMAECYPNITDEERSRNTHKPFMMYRFSEENLGEVYAPAYFPPIMESHALEVPVSLDEIVIPVDEVVRELLPNPYINTFFPGIPTLKHLEFSSALMSARVKIFEYPSRNETLVLTVSGSKSNQSLELVAADLLGKVIWVGWPYIVEAKVVAVSDSNCKMMHTAKQVSVGIENDEIMSVIKNTSEVSKSQFNQESRIFSNHYMTRLGIDVGNINILVHTVLIQGYKYTSANDGKLVHGVQWCKVPVCYPLQTILKYVEISPVANSRPYQTVEEGFPNGDSVFIVMGPHYGCMAQITDSAEIAKSGRIKVMMTMVPEPDIRVPNTIAVDQYVPAKIAAARCGISALLFARITSSLFITPTKDQETKKFSKNINIGLNMKSVKLNEELLGYTRKPDRVWLYSFRCIELVKEYVRRYFDLFVKLESSIESDSFQEDDLFSEDCGFGINDVVKWIASMTYSKSPMLPCGTDTLDPLEMEDMRQSIERQAADLIKKQQNMMIKVKPHVLFKEQLRKGNIPPDLSTTSFYLFDRVVNISSTCSVPLGYKGTVVSIIVKTKQSATKFSDNVHIDPLYLVMFDKDFGSGMKIEGVDGSQFYLMFGFNLLNITGGRSANNELNVKVHINKAQVNNINTALLNDNHNSAFAHYSSPKKAQQNFTPTEIIQSQQRLQPKNIYAAVPPHLLPTQPPPIFNPKQLHVANNNAQEAYNPPKAVHNHQGTQMLKSLLKIQNTENTENHQTFNHNVPAPLDNNMRPNNVFSQLIQSQEFYKSPPAKIQPPFPGKLISHNSAPPMPSQIQRQVTETKAPVLPPFVPLQVTKKTISQNVQTPPKNVNPANPETKSNSINLLTPIVAHPISDTTNTKPAAVKKNRKTKSRIAANFSNLN